MLQYLRRNGFELETVFPGYFLLQGAVAGILVGILTCLFVLIFSALDGDSFTSIIHGGLSNFIYRFFFYLVFCAFLCGLLSTALRLTCLLNPEMKIVTRIANVAVMTSCLFLYLFRLDKTHPTERDLIFLFINVALISIPTGSLCGSSVRLSKMFSFGTVVARGPDKWRLSSDNRFACAAMFPIRVLSFFGVAIWSVMLICLWQRWHDSYPFLAGSGLIGLYLLVSLYLSYRSPRPWILIVISCLLNFSIAGLAALAYIDPWNSFDQLARPFIVFIAMLAVSTALCVGVRTGLSIRHTPFKRRVDEIEDSHYEIDEILQIN